MGQFIARRLLGMVAVLFAISVIVFLIFNVIPNSDPAARIAGKNADPALIARVSADLGLDKPLPVQYLTMMKQIFTGQLMSYAKDRNVLVVQRSGGDMDVAGGALRLHECGACRQVHRPRADNPFAGWDLDAGLLAGGDSAVLPHLQGPAVPDGQLRATDGGSGGLGIPPDLAVVHAGRAIRRVLQPNAALQHARRYERGLRPHRSGQGALRASGPHPPRASQLDDSDCHAVRARLRAGGRRRRDPHRNGVQPERSWAVRGRGHPQPGSAAADRGDALRRVLHRAVQHDRRRRVCRAGSADPTGGGGTRMSAILTVDDLRVSFATEDGVVQAVGGVSFELKAGEVLAIVGESGSGKSVTAQTITGLTRAPNARITGAVTYRGRELNELDDDQLRDVRGEQIAMVFQDPMTSLNPVYRVGDQISEMIRAHRDVSKREAADRAVDLLRSVGIPNPERRVRHYPHEFSGGMRQRVMIAMALALEPDVLIADEPTTALDVTVQAQILRLIDQLNRDRDLAYILITHDLGVVAEIADRVLVMYAGQIVENATLDETFYDPQHPYTWGLLGSLMRLDQSRGARLAQIPGQPPSLLAPPPGCRFAPRCPHAFDKCHELPSLEARVGGHHLDRCWLDPEEKKSLRAQVIP